MDAATARFAVLVQGDDGALAANFDEAVLLLAAQARPELDIEKYRRRLDELAGGVSEPTLAAVAHELFVVEGFRGNTDDYYNADNSHLDAVLDRRLGIPISLAVVLLEVTRRLEIPVAGVGLPGHFLVRLRGDPALFLDPFDGGRLLAAAECRERFHAAYGPDAVFDPAFLEPVSPRSILRRMLANLRQIYLNRQDSAALAGVLRLRNAIPGLPVEDQAELAGVLLSLGRFDQAAAVLEALAADAPSEEAATRLRHKAVGLRARLN